MKRAIRGWTTAKQVSLKTWQLFIAMGICSSLLAGCVSSEKYQAEKARALNFQRLLAQEEKRTGELSIQIQDAQGQIASLETQKRDLAAEVQNLRQQQDMAPQMRMKQSQPEDLSLSESSLAEFGLGDIPFDESSFKEFETANPLHYTVMRGDTLYRIAREYGVTVNNLKSWNNLSSDLISVGQELIVSRP